MQILDPADGSLIRELAEDDSDAVRRKAEEAGKAAEGWRRTPFDERRRVLAAFGLLLERDRDPLASLLSSETGKPLRRARAELAALAPALDHWMAAAAALPLARPAGTHGSVEESLELQPLGLVALSSDWRAPYLEGGAVILPALVLGNAVLYRPSVHAALTGLELAKRLSEAGLPDGVLLPVLGGNNSWIVDAGIDGLFFSGSFAGGARMAQAAAGRLLPVRMLLGCKDAVYIREDADAEAAAGSIADAVRSGLGRGAPERLYVHRGIYGTFLDAFLSAFDAITLGDPSDPGTDIGPLPKPSLVDALDEAVREAVSGGAKVLRGGRRRERPGNWFEPGVLVGVDDSMSAVREESYGRLFSIQCVGTDAEAAGRIGAGEYGAAASVFTSDRGAGTAFLRRLDCGTVSLNCVGRFSPRLPSPVRGRSGFGLRGGEEGLRAFLRPKAWQVDRS